MEKQTNDVKMTLSDYYESLPASSAPKREFIERVMARCGVTQQAIYRWLKKGGMPQSKEHCDAVSEIAGISPDALFPGYTVKFANQLEEEERLWEKRLG